MNFSFSFTHSWEPPIFSYSLWCPFLSSFILFSKFPSTFVSVLFSFVCMFAFINSHLSTVPVSTRACFNGWEGPELSSSIAQCVSQSVMSSSCCSSYWVYSYLIMVSTIVLTEIDIPWSLWILIELHICQVWWQYIVKIDLINVQ